MILLNSASSDLPLKWVLIKNGNNSRPLDEIQPKTPYSWTNQKYPGRYYGL